jgi:hypothetical protein
LSDFCLAGAHRSVLSFPDRHTWTTSSHSFWRASGLTAENQIAESIFGQVVSSVVQSVSLAEPSKQQRDTDRFTAKKVRVDLAWNFDFKGHPVPLAGGLGDDPARRSSFKM